MPKQVPHKQISAAWPMVVLCALAGMLALPVVIELIRSFSDIHFSSLVSESNGHLLLARGALLARSIAIAGLIALLGTVMGLPLANILSSASTSRHRILAAVLIAPAWLPAFLLYAAGNQLRAPDTIVGNALITYATSDPSRRWMTIWAGYLIAVISLALWLAPIAGVLIASGFGVRSGLYQDMIAIEPMGCVRRSWLRLRLHRSAIARAWMLSTILMLGAAVPMHLAGLETYSIVIWRQLAESSPQQWGRVWLESWPMVLLAAVGAWWITRQMTTLAIQSTDPDPGRHLPRITKTSAGWAMMVWGLSTIVPLIAMFITLSDWRSIPYFWRSNHGAILDSGLIALLSAGVTIIVAMLCAYALGHSSRRSRRIGAWGVLVFVVLGLLPGVLVGAAIARSTLPWLDQGWLGSAVASCTRSVCIGAIIGALCAASESVERRSIRWQLVGPSVQGWTRSALPGMIAPILGSGIIAGLYALYEIEASIMVRPPGMDNLPQQLLSDLHYARLEELSAAGINLMIVGLVCSILGCGLVMGTVGIKQSGRFGNGAGS